MFLKKENWTPELLVAILLDIHEKKYFRVSNFETKNAHFFEDIKFDGRNKVRDTNFQEEHDDSVNTK